MSILQVSIKEKDSKFKYYIIKVVEYFDSHIAFSTAFANDREQQVAFAQ